MRKLFRREVDLIAIAIVVFLALLGLLPSSAFGQTELSRRCPGAFPSPANAGVTIAKDGGITLIPCSGKTVAVTGITGTGITSLGGQLGGTQTLATAANDTASWSSATNTHTLRLPITSVTGTSRTNYFPYFSGANALTKSPFSFGLTTNTFNYNTTDFDCTFCMSLRPSNTSDEAGAFSVGKSGTIEFALDHSNRILSGVTDDSGRVEFGVSSDGTRGNITNGIAINDSTLLLGDYNGTNTGAYVDWRPGDNSFEIHNGVGSFELSLNRVAIGDFNGEGSEAAVVIDHNGSGSITLGVGLSTSLQLGDGVTSVRGGKFRIQNSQTPASSSATCSTGQIAWDASYMYVCVNTNTWKRSALATW